MIQLTTPKTHDPGQSLPVETYTHVAMTTFGPIKVVGASKLASFHLEYGWVEDGQFKAGSLQLPPVVLHDTPDRREGGIDPADGQYKEQTVTGLREVSTWLGTNLINGPAVDGLDWVTGMASALYPWLIAEGHFAGTVV